MTGSITLDKLLKIVEQEESKFEHDGEVDQDGIIYPGNPNFHRIKKAIKKLKEQEDERI